MNNTTCPCDFKNSASFFSQVRHTARAAADENHGFRFQVCHQTLAEVRAQTHANLHIDAVTTIHRQASSRRSVNSTDEGGLLRANWRGTTSRNQTTTLASRYCVHWPAILRAACVPAQVVNTTLTSEPRSKSAARCSPNMIGCLAWKNLGFFESGIKIPCRKDTLEGIRKLLGFYKQIIMPLRRAPKISRIVQYTRDLSFAPGIRLNEQGSSLEGRRAKYCWIRGAGRGNRGKPPLGVAKFSRHR